MLRAETRRYILQTFCEDKKFLCLVHLIGSVRHNMSSGVPLQKYYPYFFSLNIGIFKEIVFASILKKNIIKQLLLTENPGYFFKSSC